MGFHALLSRQMVSQNPSSILDLMSYAYFFLIILMFWNLDYFS